MGVKKRVLAYSVHVEPCRLGGLGEPDEVRRLEDYRELCEKIIKQVKRHVDDIGSVHLATETECVCEHCGSFWTEDTDLHNGGCCRADCEVMRAAEAAGGK